MQRMPQNVFIYMQLLCHKIDDKISYNYHNYLQFICYYAYVCSNDNTGNVKISHTPPLFPLEPLFQKFYTHLVSIF